MYLIEVLLAYVLADAASRIAHATIGPKWLVEAFRWHPETLPIDFRLAIVGIPIGLVALLGWHPAFWVAFGAFTSYAQIFHWCAHRTPRPMQETRLPLTPEQCGVSVSRWSNWCPNFILRALRAKELEAGLIATRTLSEQRLHKLGARLEEAERQLERSQSYLNSWKLNSAAETQHWRERALVAERVATAVKEALRDDPQQSLSNLGGEVDATEKSVRTYEPHTPRGPYFGSHQ